MGKRWAIWPVAGVLLVAAVTVVALTGTFGGHRTHDVAGRTAVSPSPAGTPALVATPTPTATPTPKPNSSRRHAAASRGPATSRHGTTRSSSGRSGAGQADPCAHNHHCYVPPAPPSIPHPDPPAPVPTVTVTGAPAGP
jgi:hypothetical protein